MKGKRALPMRPRSGPLGTGPEQEADSCSTQRPDDSPSALRIRCPHCGHPMELVDDDSLRDVLCSGCGSRFSLIGNRETAARPDTALQKVGQFQLVEQVGVGHFGTVWKARDLELDRLVAVKMPRKGQLDETETEHFLREARTQAQIRHPNIVAVHEVGRTDESVYIVSDFIDGATLQEWLSAQRLSPKEAAELCLTIAGALDEAHRSGVVHRDLKPGNIMLDLAGQPYVTDFGLAKREAGEITMTVDGRLLGTPAYMSPEQARGRGHEADGRSDVYSMGVILYELLTGELPFRGDARMLIVQIIRDEPTLPKKLNGHVPRDLETICLKCLEKDPSQRYPSAAALAEDLQRFLQGSPIRARPLGLVGRAWRWCRRHPAVAVLSGLIGVTLLAVATGSTIVAAKMQDQAATLRRQRNIARDRLARAQAAERLATEHLLQSYLAQARANRWSRRVGQRFESLDVLGKASELSGLLGIDEPRRLQLRNEAIAGMTLADLETVRQWRGYSSRSTECVVGPRLQRYAQADGKGIISVREIEGDREIARLEGPSVAVRNMRISPDGRHLSAYYHADSDTQWWVWDLDRNEAILQVNDVVGTAASDFSQDGQTVAVGLRDRTVQLWDLKSRQQRRSIVLGAPPFRIHFGPQGQRLALAESGSRIVEVRTMDGEEIVKLSHPSAVFNLAWHPDGLLLATGGADYSAYVWDVAQAVQRMVLRGHEAEVVGVRFTHLGDILASWSWDGTTRFWATPGGTPLLRVNGSLLGFSPDDSRVAVSERPWLRISKFAGGRETLTLHAPAATGKGPFHIDLSRDGKLLSSSGDDGVRLWDIGSGKQVAHLPIGPSRAAIFQPDSRALITSGAFGLQRWPIEEDPSADSTILSVGAAESLLSERPLGRADLGADGRTLAVIHGGHIHVLDLRSERKSLVLSGQPGLENVAVSPQGRWIAAGSWRGRGVRIWNAQSGEQLRDLVPDARHTGVAFSPDERQLATSTEEGYRFWETDTWKPQYQIATDVTSNLPARMAFSRDGTMLALARSPRVAKLVDPRNGRELATLEPRDPQALAWFCFGPGVAQLAMGSTNRRIYLWNLEQIHRQLAKMNLQWAPQPVLPKPST